MVRVLENELNYDGDEVYASKNSLETVLASVSGLERTQNLDNNLPGTPPACEYPDNVAQYIAQVEEQP
ncbi:hypothetical protein SH501x_000907 [Pirellulaceae bacterium SH501]